MTDEILTKKLIENFGNEKHDGSPICELSDELPVVDPLWEKPYDAVAVYYTEKLESLRYKDC